MGRLPLVLVLLAGCTNDATQTRDLAASSDGGADDLAVPDESDGFVPPDLTAVEVVRYGIETRAANPSCLAPQRPAVIPTGDYSIEPLFPNLSTGANAVFGSTSPILLRRVKMPPSGAWVWFVGLRNGTIFHTTDTSISALPASLFRAKDGDYDLTQSEGGLLGLAFDPEIATNPARNFVYYIRAQWEAVTLWRAKVTTSGANYTTSEHTAILTASGTSHHYGGDVHFGPDGYLYMSVGEGDTGARARSPRNLRGKILRIDVHSTALTVNYGIPTDNPYRLNGSSMPNAACSEAGSEDAPDATHDCPEVYAMGFRNPYRFSFDRDSGALWVGDVGAQHEEIDLVERGGDYGWNTQEGTTSASASIKPAVSEVPRSGCESAGYAIVGGFVYRGSAIPSLSGKYVTADNGAGKLFVVDGAYDATRTIKTVYNGDCARTNFIPASFTEDENGELYVVSLNSATGEGIFKIVPKTIEVAPDGGAGPAPLLSGTGCFQPGVPTTPAGGLIPYDINVELWSDGLQKRRFLALPDNGAITVEANGDFTLPIGSVLIKEFRFGARLVETRLLVRHADGDWAGYAYAWNAAQTDAVLGDGAREIDLGDGKAAWTIPSRAQCLACHTIGKGRSLGLETRQMNRAVVYPGARQANQLSTLAHLGILPAAFDDAGAHPAFAQIADGTASIEARARAYLHSNCSQCHPGPGAKPDFLYDTNFATMMLCNVAPSTAVPGGTQLLVPGDATHSIVALRMRDLASYRMPRLGSARVDTQGVALIESWINGLSGCP